MTATYSLTDSVQAYLSDGAWVTKEPAAAKQFAVNNILDTFEYETIPSTNVDGTTPENTLEWNQYESDNTAGPDPGSESIDVGGGIFGSNALKIRVDSGNLYMQHYSAVSNTRWAWLREFAKSTYELDTYNRLRFWLKMPSGALSRSSNGSANLHFGTYVRSTTGSQSTQNAGGNHWYHYQDVDATGEWHQFIIDWHPNHSVGSNGATEQGERQYPTSEAGHNYFDALTRVYVDITSGSVTNADFYFDGSEFYYDPNPENVAQIYSLNGVYVPSTNEINVGWMREKTDNAVVFDIRYAFTSFHANGGWTHGTAAPSGTAAAKDIGGYNGIEYVNRTINVSGYDAIYIAIKPQGSELFREIRIPVTENGYPVIGSAE